MLNSNIKCSFPLETVISIYCHRWTWRRRRGKNEIVIILSCLPPCAPLPSLFFYACHLSLHLATKNVTTVKMMTTGRWNNFLYYWFFSLFFRCSELMIFLTSNAYKFLINCYFKRICLREKWGFHFCWWEGCPFAHFLEWQFHFLNKNPRFGWISNVQIFIKKY